MVSGMLDPPKLGPRVRDERQRRGWTLDDLASSSGISRSMLSQVERGEASPTFATLWHLTQALEVGIDDLVAEPGDSLPHRIDLLERAATPRLGDDASGAVLWLLAPAEMVGGVEWYELLLEPGGCLASAAHAVGTREHVTVLDGKITIRSAEAFETVEIGATARYAADVEHEIANPSSERARALLVVFGSETP